MYAFMAAVIAAAMIATGCIANQSTAQTVPATTTGPVVSATSTLASSAEIPAVTPTPASVSKPLETMPAVLPTVNVPAGSVAQYYVYTLNGKTGVLPLALSTSVHGVYQNTSEPSAIGGNSSYYLSFINDPAQQTTIAALAAAIKDTTDVPSEQARIAASLVQHIPAYDGPVYQYPYEVLYNDKGTSGEKSLLLAALLKQLGFGSAVFSFADEGHLASGVSAPSPYDYAGTGYALIETTEPAIITDDSTTFASGQTHTNPVVIVAGNGRTLDTVSLDYMDARTWISIMKSSPHLSDMQSQQLESLNTKYDLSYFTCQICNQSATV